MRLLQTRDQVEPSQGTEAAIVAHNTKKQEGAIRMNQQQLQHMNQC